MTWRQAAGAAIVVSAALIGACVHSDTTFCEQTGTRCPPSAECAAAAPVCIYDDCGDGEIDFDEGEVCDDGNIDDRDGCSANCLSDETCGNFIIDEEVGEECELNDPECGPNCVYDFGFCGDGFMDEEAGEECDPGDVTSIDCTPICTVSRCGDSFVNPFSGEECDSGGVDDPDCNADCTISFCGDGYPNQASGEECDARGESDTCDWDCTAPVCGDGIVNPLAGEECEEPTQCCVNCAINSGQC